MDISIVVERFRPKPANDAETWKLHEQRHNLIRGLANSFDLEIKSWIDTDKDGWPREIAEIIIALGSAGVFTAMVTAFRIWIDRNKIKEVTIKTPGGIEMKLKNATSDDVAKITKEIESNLCIHQKQIS